MAQYLFDYRDGSTPRNLTDWSFRQGNGGHRLYPGAGFLALESTGSGTKVAAFDPLNGANDVEALVRFRLTSDRGKQGIVSLRYDGTTEANTTGYTLSGSFIQNKGQLCIDEGGTGNVAWTPWNYLPNVTYWARFRVNGNTMKAKVWNDGQNEPAAWMIDTTNNVRPTGSYSGLHTYMIGTVFYSFISFGTNGDTAPRAVNRLSYQSNAKIAWPLLPVVETPGIIWGGYGGVSYGSGAYGIATIPSYSIVDTRYLSNARIEGKRNAEYAAGATIQKAEDSSYTASGIVEHIVSSTYKANATVQYQLNTKYTSSASLDISRSVEYSANANIESWHIPGDVTYKSNARIEGKTAFEYTASAIVEEINRGNYVVSAIVVDENTTKYTSGAIIEEIAALAYAASAYIGSTGDVSYHANARIEKITELNYVSGAYVSERPGTWRESSEKRESKWEELSKRKQSWFDNNSRKPSEWRE